MYIKDNVYTKYFYEQAFSKDVMLSKFTNNSDNIFNHILKVLVYNDPFNNKKHLREMSGIVRSLQYSSLQKSKLTENEIKERLTSIFKRLSNEILKKSFKSFEVYPELSDRI